MICKHCAWTHDHVHCTCSRFFRGVQVHEVQALDPNCPQHGIGTDWYRREVELES